MKFDRLPEFQKEFTRFARKYKSLPKDLQEFCNVISVIPSGNSKHFHIIYKTKTFCILKARLFCRYLKGSSLRIVYAYFEKEERIEFIELYFKGDKENEDRVRLKEYTKKLEPLPYK